MPNEAQPKKIGGEYGEVRASIDINKLNAYLAKNVPAIDPPVDVKQFKVRYVRPCADRWLLTHE